MTNNQDFLKGYFYGLFKTFTQTDGLADDFGQGMSIELNLARLYLFTPKGKVTFCINRGIAHVDGNLVIPALSLISGNEDHCLLDTHVSWNNADINKIVQLVVSVEEDEDYGEYRLNIDEVCKVLELCGGIDFEKTIKHNMTLFNTKFEDETLNI